MKKKWLIIAILIIALVWILIRIYSKSSSDQLFDDEDDDYIPNHTPSLLLDDDEILIDMDDSD